MPPRRIVNTGVHKTPAAKPRPGNKSAAVQKATRENQKKAAAAAKQAVKDKPREPVHTPPATVTEKELARRTLARRRLLYFTQQTQPGYKAGWVHDDICRRLERFSIAVTEGKSPRLMLLVPPRHGKSTLASISFPAWHLGHNPTHEIVNVGYNLDLPMTFSKKVRQTFRDPLYGAIFPDAQLNPESQGAEAWNLIKGGGFTAVGVGGGLTGKGAHILTVDDPIKNIEDADNIDVRAKLWDWYQSTAYTRLAPGGGVLVIETWWNDDDLAGRLQQLALSDPHADQFEIVRYPAIAEDFEYRDKQTLEIIRIAPDAADTTQPHPSDVTHDLLRSPGNCLHHDRYPAEALQRIRANMAPRIWSALYQQNPVPDEGMYFKAENFRYERVQPEPYNRFVYTAWDFAIGEKQQNDWTVGATLLQDESDTLHVTGIKRFKGDSFAIVEAILDTAEPYLKHHSFSYLIGFEDGQIFKAIEPLLKKRMSERRLYPSYEILKPLSDKIARARALQGRMQQGRVVFPEEVFWLETVRQELLRFPAGAHDDVVDALAWAVNLCIGKAPPRVREAKKMKTWREKLAATTGHGGSHMSA
jgi:predicted phage terminase large subunit-like protein